MPRAISPRHTLWLQHLTLDQRPTMLRPPVASQACAPLLANRCHPFPFAPQPSGAQVGSIIIMTRTLKIPESPETGPKTQGQFALGRPQMVLTTKPTSPGTYVLHVHSVSALHCECFLVNENARPAKAGDLCRATYTDHRRIRQHER